MRLDEGLVRPVQMLAQEAAEANDMLTLYMREHDIRKKGGGCDECDECDECVGAWIDRGWHVDEYLGRASRAPVE